MKKRIILFFALFLSCSVLLANAKIKIPVFPLPGRSIASPILQRDTYMPVIAYTMSMYKSCDDVNVTNTEVILPPQGLKIENNKAVSGYWEELWTVNYCSKQIQYPILFTLDGKGGAYYAIKFKDAIK